MKDKRIQQIQLSSRIRNKLQAAEALKHIARLEAELLSSRVQHLALAM